jgi:hypothetical protein
MLEVRGDLVLDFHGVKATEAAKPLHASRHAEESLPEIELVQRLIEQHSAALSFARAAPGAGSIVRLGAKTVGDGPRNALQAPDFAALEQLQELDVASVGAQGESGSDDEPLAIRASELAE